MAQNDFMLESPVPPYAMNQRIQAYDAVASRRELTADDCALFNAYLQANPATHYRLFTHPGKPPPGYEFLGGLPALRSLAITADAGDLIDLAPLGHLPPDLRWFSLDTLAMFTDPKLDRPKQHVEVLARLRQLETLILNGRLRDLAFLASFGRLRTLYLGRTRLATLDGIEACAALAELTLETTGAKDLAPLAALTELQSLELDRNPRIVSLEPLLALKRLRQLRIRASTVEGELPSLRALESLRVLALEKLATPQNLARIAAAPALRCLILSGSRALHDVDALSPLAGHPTLRELRIETHDPRIRQSIRERYGWKVEYCNLPADEYLVD